MFINSAVCSGSVIINGERWFFVRCEGNTVYCRSLREALAVARDLREVVCWMTQKKAEDENDIPAMFSAWGMSLLLQRMKG